MNSSKAFDFRPNSTIGGNPKTLGPGILEREWPFWNRTLVLFVPITSGTEYEEYRTSRVRHLLRSTVIFSKTRYKGYEEYESTY